MSDDQLHPGDALPVLLYAVETRIGLDRRLRHRVADHLGMPRKTTAKALARAFLSFGPDELTRVLRVEGTRAGDARIRKEIS